MSTAATEQRIKTHDLERVASSILVAKQYEGDGRILHDSYDKSAYIKRRLGFLGKHPDFKTEPKLLPNVTRAADQVFDAQLDELSVELVRNRELICEIEPILPFPTSTNTDTLDNFRSYGTREWTAEAGYPTHFSPSPQPSQRRSVTGPTFQNSSSSQQQQDDRDELDRFMSDPRFIDPTTPQQAVFVYPRPDSPEQQTRTNTAFQYQPSNNFNRNSQVHRSSAMNPPQGALNVPQDAATMQKIIHDLGVPKDLLRPSDLPEQYQQLHQSNRPQLQVSAVAGRGLNTPVKPPPQRGNKRTAPIDLEEADADASVEDQPTAKRPKTRVRPAAKKARVTVTAGPDPEIPKQTARPIATKAPRQAAKVAASKSAVKRKARAAAPNVSSVASAVSDAPLKKKAQRFTMGGKAPPKQSGKAASAAIARRLSHPGTVNGTRIPKSKTEAAEAAVERRQALLSQYLAKKPTARHPDLGPEFFDTANFTQDEKDPDGEPPVRCVCGTNADDGKYTGDWIGCDNEECRVWQHVSCMGAAVPAEKARETSKYLCQQCNPWAHRKLIQTLRKDHPLSK